MFAPGKLVSARYRILRLIGQGGMGSVWAAQNEAIARDVAIKVLRPDAIARDPSAIPRFFAEARMCGSIRHPGIVDVLDLGQDDDGAPFLVMELLDGRGLDTIVTKRRMPPLEILPIVRDVARTIALAHARGIVHRDLKPANLFLHRIGTGEVIVKVLDFGISKVVAAAGAQAGPDQTFRLPGTPQSSIETTVVGSPAYMSPEQSRARGEVDARTDIYSLGVILYQALSGRFPFDISNYEQLIVDLITRDPPPLAAFVSDLPPTVSELVDAALRRDPRTRIASANDLADRIDGILAQMGVVDPRRSFNALPATAVAGLPVRQDAELAAWENTGQSRIPLPVFPQAMVPTIQSAPAMATTLVGQRQRTSALVIATVAVLVATLGIAAVWFTTSSSKRSAAAAPLPAATATAVATAPPPPTAKPEPAPPTTAKPEPEPEPEPEASATATANPPKSPPPVRAARPSGSGAGAKRAVAPKKKTDRRTWGYD